MIVDAARLLFIRSTPEVKFPLNEMGIPQRNQCGKYIRVFVWIALVFGIIYRVTW